jgi:membrane protease YdiL (CAAX protease family)
MASETEDQSSGASEDPVSTEARADVPADEKSEESIANHERDDEIDYAPPGRDVILIFAVFFEGGLAPFSLFVGWLLGHMPLADFAWRWRDGLVGAAAAVPLVLGFLAIMHLPIGPLKRFQKFCDEEVTPLFAKSYWSEIALVSLSAGVGEEMLFRGVLQASFCTWFGVRWGLALSSLVFGMLHPISITYVLIAGSIGLYLGALWMWNGNLLTVMVTHAVYDFAALGYLIRIRAGDDFGEESE